MGPGFDVFIDIDFRFTKATWFMKYLFTLLSCLAAGAFFAACGSESTSEATSDIPPAQFVADPQPVPEQEVTTLAIGETAPDFRLPDVDGTFYTLDDFADARALVLIFTANHCPTAQAYEDRMQAVAADYADRGVQVVAISPNSPLGLLYEELGYTDLNDDFDAMAIRAEDRGFSFPYLYDGDTETASLQYGPVATPHAFVFDADRKLVYTGRLDDSEKPGTANAEDLRAAIDAVLAGTTPEVATTQTFGCSTKWGWKTKLKAKAEQDWEAKEVTLQMAAPAAIEALLANADSEKLRLVNFWATWCGPCVIEYPEFVAIQRMYGARDFEFVSVSMDKPAQHDKALDFLREKHSALRNLQFSEENSYLLTELVGDEWNGALPYTMLIEPGGKVVWAHQGEVDFLELKRAIVEHDMMGRYY